jgi:hypothetical protein
VTGLGRQLDDRPADALAASGDEKTACLHGMILLSVPQMRRVTSFVCGWSGEFSSKSGVRCDPVLLSFRTNVRNGDSRDFKIDTSISVLALDASRPHGHDRFPAIFETS